LFLNTGCSEKSPDKTMQSLSKYVMPKSRNTRRRCTFILVNSFDNLLIRIPFDPCQGKPVYTLLRALDYRQPMLIPAVLVKTKHDGGDI